MTDAALVQEGTRTTPGHRHVPARTGQDPGKCQAVNAILARVGDKWSVLVVVLLGPGPRRFNEIKRLANGVSQRMLTLTLRGLERDGLVRRTVTPSNPPRVDYALTELGHSLRRPVQALADWALAHRTEVEGARRCFDAGVDG